jgi:hypothetical protein
MTTTAGTTGADYALSRRKGRGVSRDNRYNWPDHDERNNRYKWPGCGLRGCGPVRGSACGPGRFAALACGPGRRFAGRFAVRPAGRAGLRGIAGDRKIIFRLTLLACGVVLSVQGNNANAKRKGDRL